MNSKSYRPVSCRTDPSDRIQVGHDDGSTAVSLRVGLNGASFSPFRTLFLTPADARRLRKQLKKAIRAAEDGEA